MALLVFIQLGFSYVLCFEPIWICCSSNLYFSFDFHFMLLWCTDPLSDFDRLRLTMKMTGEVVLAVSEFFKIGQLCCASLCYVFDCPRLWKSCMMNIERNHLYHWITYKRVMQCNLSMQFDGSVVYNFKKCSSWDNICNGTIPRMQIGLIWY